MVEFLWGSNINIEIWQWKQNLDRNSICIETFEFENVGLALKQILKRKLNVILWPWRWWVWGEGQGVCWSTNISIPLIPLSGFVFNAIFHFSGKKIKWLLYPCWFAGSLSIHIYHLWLVDCSSERDRQGDYEGNFFFFLNKNIILLQPYCFQGNKSNPMNYD